MHGVGVSNPTRDARRAAVHRSSAARIPSDRMREVCVFVQPCMCTDAFVQWGGTFACSVHACMLHVDRPPPLVCHAGMSAKLVNHCREDEWAPGEGLRRPHHCPHRRPDPQCLHTVSMWSTLSDALPNDAGAAVRWLAVAALLAWAVSRVCGRRRSVIESAPRPPRPYWIDGAIPAIINGDLPDASRRSHLRGGLVYARRFLGFDTVYVAGRPSRPCMDAGLDPWS